MQAYIASKYIVHEQINKEIRDRLEAEGIKVFLPSTININAVTEEQKKTVADKCYEAIDNSDVIIVVFPIGRSVACELGYAIDKKRSKSRQKKAPMIIAYRYEDDGEAMYSPYIDYKVESITGLVGNVKSLVPLVED